MATISNPTIVQSRRNDPEDRQLSGGQSQRMEVMGRLASGVAHDFANLLTLIAGYSDIALGALGTEDNLRPHLEEIAKAASRGARLTSQLLGFSRGRNSDPAPLDLNETVAETLRMLRPVIGEHMRIETATATDLGKVFADHGQMEQVLMNLVLNARDAMPRGGLIAIETGNAEWGEAEARTHAVESGPKVLLSVKDTGHGMDENTLAHAFDPFFTTKEHGEGTGLGLHTVKMIVRQNGGDVWARSAPDQGSTFTLCLPRLKQAAGVTGVAGTLRRDNSGSETVLVAEDDQSVRRVIGYALRLRGYQVIEANDAEEALRIFKERGSEIDLVLTDMILPGKSGRELGDQVLALRPETRLIYMSGYTDDLLLRTGALRPGMRFLQKPLRPETLAATVREALDSPVRPFNPQ